MGIADEEFFAGSLPAGKEFSKNVIRGEESMRCPHCRIPMRRLESSEGNTHGIMLGVALCAFGVLLLFFPCAGWVFGPILILCGLAQGGRRLRSYHCPNCGLSHGHGRGPIPAQPSTRNAALRRLADELDQIARDE